MNVSYVPGLGFNLYRYSLDAYHKTHALISEAFTTHNIGTNLTFYRSSSGSHVRAVRLLAGTVKIRQRNMRANVVDNPFLFRLHATSPRHHPEVPWTPPVWAAQTNPPRGIYVPMLKTVPVGVPFPALAAPPPAPAPAATPATHISIESSGSSVSKPSVPIPPRVSRKI